MHEMHSNLPRTLFSNSDLVVFVTGQSCQPGQSLNKRSGVSLLCWKVSFSSSPFLIFWVLLYGATGREMESEKAFSHTAHVEGAAL